MHEFADIYVLLNTFLKLEFPILPLYTHGKIKR